MFYVSREIHTRRCCCTVFTIFEYCHTAAHSRSYCHAVCECMHVVCNVLKLDRWILWNLSAIFIHNENKRRRFLCGYQVHENEEGDVTLKLADFGLALEVVKPIFMVCGTPTYVAPEILSHTGQHSHGHLCSSVQP